MHRLAPPPPRRRHPLTMRRRCTLRQARVYMFTSLGRKQRLPDIDMSWFFRVFGFEEFIQGVRHDVFAHVRKQLSITSTGDSHVLTNAQGTRFWVGRFTQQSLLSLREELGVRTRASCVAVSCSRFPRRRFKPRPLPFPFLTRFPFVFLHSSLPKSVQLFGWGITRVCFARAHRLYFFLNHLHPSLPGLRYNDAPPPPPPPP
jgi:hypothetical protein